MVHDRPNAPQFPTGIAAALRQSLEAPALSVSLTMRIEPTPLSENHIVLRGWLRMKPTYVERQFVDSEDIAMIESVLEGTRSTLTARLLVQAIIKGLRAQHESLGGVPSEKFAATRTGS